MDRHTDDRFYQNAPEAPTHTEQYDTDLADDDLNRIVSLKEELTSFIDPAFPSTRTDHVHAKLVIEQEFDEAYTSEWHRLTAISGGIEWSANIPTSDALRLKRHAIDAARMRMKAPERFDIERVAKLNLDTSTRVACASNSGAAIVREFDGEGA